MRMSAGSRWYRARSRDGVSPVRIATVGSRYGMPRRWACRVMPTSGSRRLRSTSTASALSGETYTIRVAGFFGAGENMRWSIAARNAASVFPEPVGARTRTLSPLAIAGQASSCARVGVWKVASNHARVAGLKLASGSVPTNIEVSVRRDGDRAAGCRESAREGGPAYGPPFSLAVLGLVHFYVAMNRMAARVVASVENDPVRIAPVGAVGIREFDPKEMTSRTVDRRGSVDVGQLLIRAARYGQDIDGMHI